MSASEEIRTADGRLWRVTVRGPVVHVHEVHEAPDAADAARAVLDAARDAEDVERLVRGAVDAYAAAGAEVLRLVCSTSASAPEWPADTPDEHAAAWDVAIGIARGLTHAEILRRHRP